MWGGLGKLSEPERRAQNETNTRRKTTSHGQNIVLVPTSMDGVAPKTSAPNSSVGTMLCSLFRQLNFVADPRRGDTEIFFEQDHERFVPVDSKRSAEETG